MTYVAFSDKLTVSFAGLIGGYGTGSQGVQGPSKVSLAPGLGSPLLFWCVDAKAVRALP